MDKYELKLLKKRIKYLKKMLKLSHKVDFVLLTYEIKKDIEILENIINNK